MIIGYILFILIGFALGYAIAGAGAWLALLVPVLFAALTALSQGVDGELIIMLIVALVLTAVAVVAGQLLDRYLRRRKEHA